MHVRWKACMNYFTQFEYNHMLLYLKTILIKFFMIYGKNTLVGNKGKLLKKSFNTAQELLIIFRTMGF